MWDVLKASPDADWVEFRKQHNRLWLTKDRRIVLIKNMQSDYILSCVNMLEALSQTNTAAYKGLIKELRQRGSQIPDNSIQKRG